jgi:hypothetical protein
MEVWISSGSASEGGLESPDLPDRPRVTLPLGWSAQPPPGPPRFSVKFEAPVPGSRGGGVRGRG